MISYVLGTKATRWRAGGWAESVSYGQLKLENEEMNSY
jgi:hypothetical protein